jgi:hypothetical protein
MTESDLLRRNEVTSDTRLPSCAYPDGYSAMAAVTRHPTERGRRCSK